MRTIWYAPSFDAAVETLGGYRAIDKALEPIMDGLYRNPYGFRFIENDWVRVRYIITKRIAEIPSLLVIFRIEENNDVTLVHVEERHAY